MTVLRVATFNLLHGMALDDGTAGPRRLAEALGKLDADIVALQEVDRHQERSSGADQAAVAARAVGAHDWRFLAAVHGVPAPVSGWLPDPVGPERNVYGPEQVGAGGPSYGIALLSRLPVRQWRARRFPAAPVSLPLRVQGRPGLTRVPDEPRSVLAAVVEAPSGPLTVLAAHLSFVPGWNVSQLSRIGRSTADLPQPQLLLGDFNLPGRIPQAVVGRRNRGDTSRPRRHRVRWRSLARVPTYPSYRPRVQFDHVFGHGVGPDAVRRTETVRMGVSDHCALVVELEL
ncbi:endonuclease/exonuclease/phosphatase family protein [Yinghuangia seranimata]|uniref:endonuclease/exonuclease/phosphatase family protein n=1 Tax=Yinghuangia seranimata TaxID=408067 RepID=UPI00248B7965|nr:endonuclease/exonuclease/phosphatase family protein [Yinghuangia seranimata]MDI2131030.1 endonuclease/exonuclease/phosphatase family protein [Yinghuangia seranimata]